MSSVTIALLVFAGIMTGAILGMGLRSILPEHHLGSGSVDAIKLAIGLIATLSALVLGLLVSTAKASFDRINNSLIENAARVVMLDHVLGEYGTQTAPLRADLKREYRARVRAMTSDSTAELAALDSPKVRAEFERIMSGIAQLAPTNDAQSAAKARALQVAGEILNARTLLTLHMHGTLSMPMLLILASWLTIIFAGFGLIGHRNSTVSAAIFLGAVAVAGAILLILEMDQPFGGLISITDKPLQDALVHLGH